MTSVAPDTSSSPPESPAPDATPLVEVDDLHVNYSGSIRALQGVSLVVPAGKIVAILGANGSGKTTLLRALCGLLGFHNGAISQGSFRLWGAPGGKLAPQRIVRGGVGQVLEGRRIFSELTVEDNLELGAITVRSRAAVQRSKREMFDYFPVLEQRCGSVAGYLSGGEQQMLAIARALMSEPKLLLLDEPSLGLAPIITQQIAEIIARIAERGTTVVLAEQNAAMALALSDYAYIFRNGKVAREGESAVLREDKSQMELYLGGAPSE